MIDSDAPVAASYDDLSATGLASLYREVGFNDPARRDRGGSMGDRNTELLLTKPIRGRCERPRESARTPVDWLS